jgi:hypothetical protein
MNYVFQPSVLVLSTYSLSRCESPEPIAFVHLECPVISNVSIMIVGRVLIERFCLLEQVPLNLSSPPTDEKNDFAGR